MKKLILSLLISLSITTQAAADSVKIAALINGEIISTEDISDQIDIFMVSSPIPFNADTQEMITRRVLAQAVELKLKNQAAEKEGISVSEEEINQQLNQWAKKNNTTLSALKNRGINKAALAANVKAELAWIKLIRKKYYQTGSLTQKEINETIEEVTKDMSVKKSSFGNFYQKRKCCRNRTIGRKIAGRSAF